MNRADLDARNTAAIRKHARALADSDGKATRALLDDLAAIADEHALSAVVKEQVREAYDVPQELRQAWDEISRTPDPSLVAADTEAPEGGSDPPSAAAGRTVAVRTPRTRTRTRGGAK